MNNSIAIIPARGGSKGIPHKNIRLLAGKPLITYTIEAALHASMIDRVVVSTDDTEIASVAKAYGAEIVWRPAELSDDLASSETALLHALDELYPAGDSYPELTIFLQCTSPLTLPQDIDGTIQSLLSQNTDSALTVTPFHYFLWQTGPDGNANGINHNKAIRQLRQERTSQYKETGAVYVMRTEGLIQAKHRFFGKTSIYEMPPERCLEIDELFDFELAEAMIYKRNRQDKCSLLPNKIDALVLDFDGVFTDNRVMVMEDGSEAVHCSRSDGMGLSQLKQIGLPMLVISTEENPVVTTRCRKLSIECIQNVQNKLATMTSWLDQQKLIADNTIYVGNDINDLDCLQTVGCPVVVNDAHSTIVNVAKIILNNRGGQGAIRELADLIMTKMERA